MRNIEWEIAHKINEPLEGILHSFEARENPEPAIDAEAHYEIVGACKYLFINYLERAFKYKESMMEGFPQKLIIHLEKVLDQSDFDWKNKKDFLNFVLFVYETEDISEVGKRNFIYENYFKS